MSGHLHVSATSLSPGKDPLLPIGEEAGWAPEPVLALPSVAQSMEVDSNSSE
jgi:hypothetical protein